MYEEDIEETIIIAELEWKPQSVFIDWSSPDFTQEIVNRTKGVTEEGFAKEVELWRQSIESLPAYDEIEIRKELRSWHIGIPSKDDFDFQTYALHYSLQIQYRNRLTEIHSVVYAHYEMISQGQKTLKEMAVKLAAGNNKYDKDAVSAYTVHQFTVAMTHAKKLLIYLEAMLKNIDFAATQMDRMLREHQTLAKINQNFNNEGMSSFISRDRNPFLQKNSDSVVIKTRNNRLNINQNNS
jgi:hypothetical protein